MNQRPCCCQQLFNDLSDFCEIFNDICVNCIMTFGKFADRSNIDICENFAEGFGLDFVESVASIDYSFDD